jgi:hypothetical protein
MALSQLHLCKVDLVETSCESLWHKSLFNAYFIISLNLVFFPEHHLLTLLNLFLMALLDGLSSLHFVVTLVDFILNCIPVELCLNVANDMFNLVQVLGKNFRFCQIRDLQKVLLRCLPGIFQRNSAFR